MKKSALCITISFGLLLTSCQTVEEVTPTTSSGFLKNTANLQPMNGDPRTLYYEDQNANWKKYKRIIILPVRIQRLGPPSSQTMSRADRLKLGIYFEYTMRDFVSENYQIATQKAHDVLLVRAAINDVQSADSMAGIFATSASSGGSVSMEGEIVDSMTGKRLIAMVDLKAGSSYANFSNWDDVAVVFDKWGEQLKGMLVERLGDVPEDYRPPEQKAVATVSPSVAKAAVAKAIARAKRAARLEMQAEIEAKREAEEARIATKAAVAAEALAASQSDDDSKRRAKQASQKAKVATAKAEEAESVKLAAQKKADDEASAKLRADETAVKAAAIASAAAEKKAATEATANAKKAAQTASDPWKGQPGTGNASFSGKLKPFMLGIKTKSSIEDTTKAAKERLSKAGFSIIGEYSPYNNVQVIVVTNNTLKSTASQSKFGGYGAAIRIAITKAGGTTQVAYVNPVYMLHSYRMSGDLSGVANSLGKALGHLKTFGSKSGIKSAKLRKWRYMFGMPYFDDPVKIASLGNHSNAVDTVDNNLKSGKAGVKRVFRIDIPGKKETLFGVAITRGSGADKKVMSAIDTASIKHSAHLPYGLLVSNGVVYTLNGKFRIASSFPDLTMGQFMGIKSAPGGIEKSFKSAVK